MSEFNDFDRNNNLSNKYSNNSFVGKWYDYGVWSDQEYWKLEKDLLKIKKKYPYPLEIPRDIVAGIFEITDFLIVPDWTKFDIEPSPWLSDKITIYARYERFKSMVNSIFTGVEIANDDFDYFYIDKV